MKIRAKQCTSNLLISQNPTLTWVAIFCAWAMACWKKSLVIGGEAPVVSDDIAESWSKEKKKEINWASVFLSGDWAVFFFYFFYYLVNQIILTVSFNFGLLNLVLTIFTIFQKKNLSFKNFRQMKFLYSTNN